MPACLPACLPDCLPACLPACPPVCLPGCVFACLPCLFFCRYDKLLERLEQGLVQQGKPDLSKAIRSAEERAAAGMTKYTMAEAELKNYKEFMAKTIKTYTTKIASLKKQLAAKA